MIFSNKDHISGIIEELGETFDNNSLAIVLVNKPETAKNLIKEMPKKYKEFTFYIDNEMAEEDVNKIVNLSSE